MNNFEVIKLLNKMIDDKRDISIDIKLSYINKSLTNWQNIALMQ